MNTTQALNTVHVNPTHSVYARTDHGVSFDLSYTGGRWNVTVMPRWDAPLTKHYRTQAGAVAFIERYAKTEILRWQ